MPLLVLCGLPSSGKTTLTQRFVDYFRSQYPSIVVEIVDDDGIIGAFRQSIFNDSHKEREQRNSLRSEVQKKLQKDNLIICDSMNYIKGFRYELFCIGKLVQTTYAMIFCNASLSTCQWLNSQTDDINRRYSPETLVELSMRFEPPNVKNRWDSPLFTIDIIGDDHSNNDNAPRSIPLPCSSIVECLMQGKALTANLSTQSVPLASTNFLHNLDAITHDVVQSIIDQQKTAILGDQLVIAHTDIRYNLLRTRTLADLSRLRRQFIVYTKMHPIEGQQQIVTVFVNFLNCNQ